MIKLFIQKTLLLSAFALMIMSWLLYKDQTGYARISAKFSRNYQAYSIKPFAQFALSFSPGEILNIINQDTLLINGREGQKLYWLDLKHKESVEFKPPNIRDRYDRIITAAYDQHTLLLLTGNSRTVLKQTLFPTKAGQTIVDTMLFGITKGLPLHGSRMVIKKPVGYKSGCRLFIYDAFSRISKEDTVSFLNFGDCLTSDGHLAYDGKNAVYYVNTYNSSFTKFDTSLHRVFLKNTIDGTQTLPTVKYDAATKSESFRGPHRIINQFIAADPNHLFVLSGVMANNDLHSTFTNHVPIDIYNANSGAYELSFHLENININRMKGFKISHNILFIITDSYLYLYNYKNALHENS